MSLVSITRTPIAAGDAFLIGDILDRARLEHGQPLDHADAARCARAAAAEAESRFGLALLRQAVVEHHDAWPEGGRFRLAVSPVQTFAGVTILFGEDPFATFTVTGYAPAIIRPIGPPWPGPFAVHYTAGFGDTAHTLPADIRMAIADQAALLFDQRGGGDPKAPALAPAFVRAGARWRGARLA